MCQDPRHVNYFDGPAVLFCRTGQFMNKCQACSGLVTHRLTYVFVRGDS